MATRRHSASTTGATPPAPLATVAALDGTAFALVQPTDAIPLAWEDRARKAWTYYVEEPLVKHCLNAWRAFAVGDAIRLTSDDEAVAAAVADLHDALGLSTFVKDMVLQLLVKGDAVAFKRYTRDGAGIEGVTCVNPVSVKVKYAGGELVEMRQYPEDMPAAGDGLLLPAEQVLHLRWDAPPFAPRGNSMILPAFQAIELLRDYRHQRPVDPPAHLQRPGGKAAGVAGAGRQGGGVRPCAEAAHRPGAGEGVGDAGVAGGAYRGPGVCAGRCPVGQHRRQAGSALHVPSRRRRPRRRASQAGVPRPGRAGVALQAH
jgi:hypothetical protein